MRISELMSGLEILKKRYGDCVVMVADENYDAEIACSNLELSEAVLNKPNGEAYGVALLEVLLSDSKVDDSGNEQADKNENCEKSIENHEDINEFYDGLAEIAESIFGPKVPKPEDQKTVSVKELQHSLKQLERKMNSKIKVMVEDALSEY